MYHECFMIDSYSTLVMQNTIKRNIFIFNTLFECLLVSDENKWQQSCERYMQSHECKFTKLSSYHFVTLPIRLSKGKWTLVIIDNEMLQIAYNQSLVPELVITRFKTFFQG